MTAHDLPTRLGTQVLFPLALGIVLMLAGCQNAATTQDEAAPTAPTAAVAAVSTETGLGAAAATVAPIMPANSTPAPSPTYTPVPTASPTATTTPTTAPVARRLTEGGCCVDPVVVDGRAVFIDRPDPNAPAAFYAVPIEGGDVTLFEARLGFFHNKGMYFSYPEGDAAVIERRTDGQQWRVNTQGQPVAVAPEGHAISWSIRQYVGPFDRRPTELWMARLEDGQPRQVMTLLGGGLSAWLPGERWLLTGRRSSEEQERALFVYDLNTGQTIDLFRAMQFRSVSASPDGAWVLLTAVMETDRARNGLWLLRTDGSEQRKLDWFGAYTWRDDGQLLYLPFNPGTTSHEVWLYEVASGQSRRLTDPAVTPFKIAQGDFAFALDGSAIVYLSAEDRNLWVVELERK